MALAQAISLKAGDRLGTGEPPLLRLRFLEICSTYSSSLPAVSSLNRREVQFVVPAKTGIHK